MPVIPKPEGEPPLFGGGAMVIFGVRRLGRPKPDEGDGGDAVIPQFVDLIERWSTDVIDLGNMKVPSAKPDA